MGDISNEPSMEDILASIKKIISEDSTRALAPDRKVARPLAGATDDDVLELTRIADPEPVAMQVAAEPAEELVSSSAAEASRSALDALSRIIVKPEVAGSDTLEGMVRDMLRPMLKDWLDANLPAIVERVVAQEVARISGR